MNKYEFKFIVGVCQAILTKPINANTITDAIDKLSEPYKMLGQQIEILSVKRVA